MTPEQLIEALKALPPEQQQQVCAAAGITAAPAAPPADKDGKMAAPVPATPPAAPTPPASGAANMTVGDKSPNQDKQKGAMELFDEWNRPSRNHSAAFSAFAADPSCSPDMKKFAACMSAYFADAEEKDKKREEQFADMTKRMSAYDAKMSAEKEDKEAEEKKAFSASLDDFYSRNDNGKRIAPAVWDAKKEYLKNLRFTHTFSDAKTRDAEIQRELDIIAKQPVNPLFVAGGSKTPPVDASGKPVPEPVSPWVEDMLNSESARRSSVALRAKAMLGVK